MVMQNKVVLEMKFILDHGVFMTTSSMIAGYWLDIRNTMPMSFLSICLHKDESDHKPNSDDKSDNDNAPQSFRR